MNDRVIALIAARVAEVTRVPVVIDDGSQDDTAAIARAAGATVLRHAQNRGKGAAIQTAFDFFQQSGAEFAILLDADGQHDPDEIPAFLRAVEQTGADIVVGTRMGQTRDMPWLRRAVNRFTSWVTGRLARQRIPDSQCGYRLLRRSVLPVLKLATTNYETETEMLVQAGRVGRKICSVPIRTIYDGQPSRIRPYQDGMRFVRLVAKYLRS